MSDAETQSAQAEKGEHGAQPLTRKERLLREVTNFQIMFEAAIANAEVMADEGRGTFEECLKESLRHDADLRLTTPDNAYQAGLAVRQLRKGHHIIRDFILKQAQSRPLPRRGKNPRWRKLKSKRTN
jgi:hypothetical protein